MGDGHSVSATILRDLSDGPLAECDTQAFPPLPSSQNIPKTDVGIERDQSKAPETSIDGAIPQS